MPSEETHEGIVLRSIDFKDRQKIITLYTPARGLISLIVKGINRKKSHLLTLTSPFTVAEYHFSIRRSELYNFVDGTPLFTNQSLRGHLPQLLGASTFAKALLASQLPGKPSSRLYQLTLAYLKYLPLFEDPAPLTSSYHLKLLKHDGHLNPSHPEIPFTHSEWEAMLPLLHARSIKQLEIAIPLELHHKIEKYFYKKIES